MTKDSITFGARCFWSHDFFLKNRRKKLSQIIKKLINEEFQRTWLLKKFQLRDFAECYKNFTNGLISLYIWTPYTYSTKDRVWQKNYHFSEPDAFHVKKFLKKSCGKSSIQLFETNLSDGNSTEGDSLKISRFAITRKSLKNSKNEFSSLYIWTPYTHSTKGRL